MSSTFLFSSTRCRGQSQDVKVFYLRWEWWVKAENVNIGVVIYLCLSYLHATPRHVHYASKCLIRFFDKGQMGGVIQSSSALTVVLCWLLLCHWCKLVYCGWYKTTIRYLENSRCQQIFIQIINNTQYFDAWLSSVVCPWRRSSSTCVYCCRGLAGCQGVAMLMCSKESSQVSLLMKHKTRHYTATCDVYLSQHSQQMFIISSNNTHNHPEHNTGTVSIPELQWNIKEGNVNALLTSKTANAVPVSVNRGRQRTWWTLH